MPDFILCYSLDLGPNVLEHSYHAYSMPDFFLWYSLDLDPNVLDHSYHAYSMPDVIVWYSLDLGPKLLEHFILLAWFFKKNNLTQSLSGETLSKINPVISLPTG